MIKKTSIVNINLIILLTMFSLLSTSCIKKNESKPINYSSIENEYVGAFDTFYKYIKTLNENKLSNEKMAELFNINFSMIIGNPTLNLSSLPEIVGVYNDIRNNTYSFICDPYDFNELKLAKLSYLPLTKKSVNIGLLDVFLCSENRIPSYKMAFIYNLIYDDSKEKWLMNALTEVNPKYYPTDWRQVEIRDSFRYNGENDVNEIEPLLASELMKGNKSID